MICLFSVALNVVLLSLGMNGTAMRREYPYLSPRLFVSNPNDTIINFTSLRKELQSSVAEISRQFNVGIYFEYLPTGVSIGVNEKEAFVSASLLKVPFVMGVFRLIEAGDLREDDVLTLQKSDLDMDFGTLWQRGEGAHLSVRDAVKWLLVHSDNTALLALNRHVNEDLVREVYDALDIPVDIQADRLVVTPKNYSSVLRCLYLSCLLTRAHSDALLDLLAHTEFLAGVQAGVPQGISVAHKVGYYDLADSEDRVRSDCGIVYAPKRPYILCGFGKMKRGQEQLFTSFMQSVSARIYQYVAGAP